MSTTIQEGPLAGVGPSTQPGTPRANPALRGPILLATDGAGQSGAAAIAARLLARHLNVPLEVVSVLPLQLPDGDALGGAPIYLPEVDDVQRKARTAAVLEYIAKFSEGDVPPVHVRFGGIADAIAYVARERNATLVVVGAAPHQRVNRIIGGERAVHVLRASSVPVLSVPPGFAALPLPFQGMIRFSGGSINIVGLRSRINSRGDFLITTMLPIDETKPPSTQELVFPHLASGGGYTTQFILLSGTAGQTSNGALWLFSQNGQPLNLPLQ